MWYAYNFSGDMAESKHVHTTEGGVSLTKYYTYYYDHGGRLASVYHQLDGGKRICLISNTYDELGRVSDRQVHDLAALSLNYTYNIRSWLMNIKGNLFSQSLEYVDGSYGRYSGDITGVSYRYGLEQTEYSYDLEYDMLDWLINAEHWKAGQTPTPVERVIYDKNSNILGLQRYGQIGVNSYGFVDELSYTYDGNQLKAVNDTAKYSVYDNGFEFKDGAKTAVEYVYDANGNLIKDLNKNIIDIQYNYLNLPSLIQFGDGSSISYLYDANGVKLQTTHVINGVTTTTDYCGNLIYENGVLGTLLTNAGYITFADKVYHYYLQDHQGNNCVVIDQTGEIEETNHYYPFGGIFAGTNSIQPYKYNGKELDTKKDLNWYDYRARMYDVTLGKFMNVDPLAENYYWISPYVYCENNPINFIDPTGMASQYPPGGRGGFWDWSDYKFKKVSSSAQATDAAANRVFEGTGIGISYSVGSVKGKLGIGSVEGKFDVGFGNLSLKTKGTETSAAGSLVEAQAKVSVNSVSGNAGVTMGKGKIAIDANGVNTDFDMFSANAKVQVGNNSNTKLDSSGTVSVGAKAGPVDANVSINFKAAGEWIVGLIETVAKILSPEIILDPHKKE